MSFWNNPENNSLKTIMIIAIVVILGFFAYKYVHQSALGNQGKVIDTSTVAANTMAESPTTPTSASDLSIIADPSYGDQTISPATSHYKVGSYKITNTSTESVRLTSLLVGFTGLSSSTAGELTNISATVNGVSTGVPIALSPAFTGTIPASYVLASGASTNVDLYADVGTGPLASFRSNLLVTGTGVTTGATFRTHGGSSYSGQAVYIRMPSTSGALIITRNAAYPNQTIYPNTVHQKIASFLVQNSSSEAITINTVHMFPTLGTISYTDLSNTTITVNGSVVGSVMPSSVDIHVAPIFSLPSGMYATVDFYADVGSVPSGTFITSSLISGTGATTHATYPPGAVSSVVGQTITVSSTCTVTPTLETSSSTSSQYIAAGSTGATDATRAVFKLVSPTATTLNEVKLTVAGSSTATSARIGSVSAPFVSGVAHLTGLSIAIPTGTAGTLLTVYISYPAVGASGIASGTTSTVSLTYLKFNCSGTTATSTPSVSAPTMKLVASKPSITVVSPVPGNRLAVGMNEVIDINVTADAHGAVKLSTLPLLFSPTHVTLDTAANNIVVKDFSGTTVPTSNTAMAGGYTVITFSSGYTVAAGSSQGFRVSIPVTALTGTGPLPNAILSTLLSPGMGMVGFEWVDVSGGATAPEGGAYYMPSFPATPGIIHN